VTFRCRYCQEQTGSIRSPQTDVEQFWFKAFLELHERCGVGAVEPVPVVPRSAPSEEGSQEVQTPATLRHEHAWLAITQTNDPAVFVQDCTCGARQRIRQEVSGRLEVLNDGLVDGGSAANCIFMIEAGSPTKDRWGH